MKIKKANVIGVLFIICISLGLFLIQVLFQGLGSYGFIGYLYFFLFMVSLIWIVIYQRNFNIQKEIARQVAEQVAQEYRDIPDAKSELESHLVSKIYNEHYELFGKKKRLRKFVVDALREAKNELGNKSKHEK